MKKYRNNSRNNVTLGLLILLVGSILLLKRMGILFPDWIFSWPMILIALGLVVLVKHQFKSGFGYIMLFLGTYFLLKEEFYLLFDIGLYFVPIGLILIGLYLIFFKGKGRDDPWNDWGNPKPKSRNPFYTGNPEDKIFTGKETSAPDPRQKGLEDYNTDRGDILSSQALFCGVKKRVLSKNFHGGKVSAFFGGTEIDLSQADLGQHAFLNVDVAFGGVKLIVPSHWDLQIDVTNIFAGIEDKRIYPQTTPDPSKVLVIKGTVIFGGLDIKSF